MKFSLLLGTYGSRLKDLDFLFDSLDRQTYKNFEVIVGSQTNFDEIEEILKKHSFEYKHVFAGGTGCAVSRNATMDLASGDVYTFTDDDCWYKDDALEIVKGYFDECNPDVAIFQHYDPKKKKSTINYPKEKIMGIKRFQTLKQATLDMWFNSKSIDSHTHKFDERFGIGTKYNSGEENIYIMDAYNEGKRKMFYFPEIVAYHPYKEVNYIDEKSMIGKGPLFKRLFGSFLGFFIFIAFAIKKKKEIENNNDGKFWSIFSSSLKEQIKFKL
ncbi:glycosyltransferase family 2 protein [Peptostreptococcus faecalis]|uniref:glycosyltransferase family 2 protein n=1 Tax=Peptostreptococcus faecalis TaxID=2045015 RepID=UPI000C7D4530|nr:glycosyltransferase family 2 protein [Peptostreptococcus faecalis]